MTNDTDGIKLPQELQAYVDTTDGLAAKCGVPIVTGNKWGIKMGLYFPADDGLWYPAPTDVKE